MNIRAIRTLRAFESWPSHHLVYEWEDLISNIMKLNLIHESKQLFYLNLLVRKFGFNFLKLYGLHRSTHLKFDMTAKIKSDSYNRKNIVPAIIDFFISENDLNSFKEAYNKNPFLLISSAEVMHFLKENEFSLKYFHFPLSISDKYKITINTHFDKKWDLVLMGRQNSFLEECLNKYVTKNSDFVYVYRQLIDGKFLYQTNKGELIGEFSSRESYIELMRQSRIGLYATPGIDGGEERTKGFNPVTPRFLELIASGCHIIAKYSKNQDTDFFNLADFCPSIETYDQFEVEMNKALHNKVSMEKYANYLNNHYTSNRASLLMRIEKEYNKEFA